MNVMRVTMSQTHCIICGHYIVITLHIAHNNVMHVMHVTKSTIHHVMHIHQTLMEYHCNAYNTVTYATLPPQREPNGVMTLIYIKS